MTFYERQTSLVSMETDISMWGTLLTDLAPHHLKIQNIGKYDLFCVSIIVCPYHTA